MQYFKADLHIHTVLSPCGDLDASPKNIVENAVNRGLQIIGVTDHNTTRHCRLIAQMAQKHGIFVLCGAEVTTREEAHCLCFFPGFKELEIFQDYLDKHLPDFPNNTDKFGYQVQVDEAEQIIYEEKRLLISAISQDVEQIEEKVHSLGGLFIPAHINRQTYSIISQLGFVPDDLRYDALEISRHTTREKFISQNPYLSDKTFIQSSDAHYVRDIGTVTTKFWIEACNFDEIKWALHNENGRKVEVGG
jgi:3',5'-nucleoside bisphosphate phosphatase